MVFLWHELGYIDYAEEHTSLTFKRQQKDAAFLRQSHIVKHRQAIENNLEPKT